MVSRHAYTSNREHIVDVLYVFCNFSGGFLQLTDVLLQLLVTACHLGNLSPGAKEADTFPFIIHRQDLHLVKAFSSSQQPFHRGVLLIIVNNACGMEYLEILIQNILDVCYILDSDFCLSYLLTLNTESPGSSLVHVGHDAVFIKEGHTH